MIDDDLRQLNEGALDHSLNGLESDVWAGLAVRSRNRAAVRRRVSFQGVVMVLALVGSVAVGINATRSAGSARGRAVLALGLELTPSSLLLGNAR
jgi:hypothetical protein